ncbi:MAG: SHOCT domain-containing protein [Clostridia bacterium]
MEDYLLMTSFVSLAIAAGLAFIPANIAKSKGYSFGLWWFYGWMLFIVAIIHVSFIPDKNAQQTPINAASYIPYWPPSNTRQSAADELKKYKELKDIGVITEEEFQAKKDQLFKLM